MDLGFAVQMDLGFAVQTLGNILMCAGMSTSAYIAWRQQRRDVAIIELEESDRVEDRQLVHEIRSRHRAYFLGLTTEQRRLFWRAVFLAIAGSFLGLLAPFL